MPEIIRDRRIVEDHWIHLADEQPPPPGAAVIVPLERWQRERDRLLQQSGMGVRIGVRIGGDVPLAVLEADLPFLDLIALEFGSFRDGRCLSLAHLLRERYLYKGELRAVGEVFRDQLFLMHRAGINVFEVQGEGNLLAALQAFNEFSLAYQPAPEGPHVPRRRWRA